MKNSALYFLLKGYLSKKKKKAILFGSIFTTNFVAAFFEGISFAILLLALTIFSEGSLQSLQEKNWFFFSFFQQLADGVASSKLLFLFISLAVFSQIIRSSLTYLGQVVSIFLGNSIQIELQERVYKQLLKFSFSWVSRYKVGDLVQCTNIPQTVIPSLIDALNRGVVSFLTVISLLSMMFFLSPFLFLCTLVAFAGVVFPLKYIIKKINKLSINCSNHLVEFNKSVVQSLYALRLVHTFNRKNYVTKQILYSLNQIAFFKKRLCLWIQAIPFINEVMGMVLIGALLIAGQLLIAVQGKEVASSILTFMTMLYRLNTRVRDLLAAWSEVASCNGSIVRLKEILQDEGKEYFYEGKHDLKTFQKSIIFNQVELVYPGTCHLVLPKLSFTIEKGTMAAFVGASGAGKSSIIDLLLRLYEPTSGEILVDQKNLKEIDIESWRSKLGVVSQDIFIFNETIEENIRFGKLNATLEEVQIAAKLAGAHEFICQLKSGYQTLLGERGYRLSGGEKQRIALARALVRDPEILILDEATSSLDTHSEKYIQTALDKLQNKKTMIVVAHRLSTILEADIIFVMDKGKIIESGSHEQLLQKKNAYFSLWKTQQKSSEHSLKELGVS